MERATRQLRHAPRVRVKIDDAIYKVTPPVLQKSSWYKLFSEAVKILAMVLFYYSFSISLTFYNKWLFQRFQFPLSVTIYHLALKFVIAMIVRHLLSRFTDIPTVTLSWKAYLTKVTPTGLTSAFDIGFSNWSMLYITVQLYTMSKSTCIIFILVFGIIFKLQEPHFYQVFIIFLIAGGLFMFTYHSTNFNLTGFTLVIIAAILSGIRWSLAQILTQTDTKEQGLKNPVDTIYHLQPIMILGLLPLSIPVEGLEIATSVHCFGYQDYSVFFSTVAIVSIGAALAFMLALSEYLLVSQTSSLTLSISGIFKEICTLYLAINYFGKHGGKLSTINLLGMVICLAGITLHVVTKSLLVKKSPAVVSNKEDSLPMLLNGLANEGSDSEEEVYSRRKQVSRL